LGKHAGMYKSTKRKKELARQKKQEEKRQKRLHKATDAEQLNEETVTESSESSGAE
jgi:hypothetical protein